MDTRKAEQESYLFFISLSRLALTEMSLDFSFDNVTAVP